MSICNVVSTVNMAFSSVEFTNLVCVAMWKVLHAPASEVGGPEKGLLLSMAECGLEYGTGNPCQQ